MHCVDLIARCLPAREPPEQTQVGMCCVTGAETDTIARKRAIQPTFTNRDILAAPLSDRVGVAAWACLTHTAPNPGKKRSRRPLQQSAWCCDGQDLRMLSRQGVRDMVLSRPPKSQWAGYATTSYKKHGVLLAPVNTGSRAVWCWETELVDCSDANLVMDYWRAMRAAQDAGIHRPIIERLDIGPAYMAKVGWQTWLEFERWARPRYRSALYRFIAYLLPSKDELKAMSQETPAPQPEPKKEVAQCDLFE